MRPEGIAIQHPDRLWIGGDWCVAQSGRMIDLISPDTELVLTHDTDAAYRIARRIRSGAIGQNGLRMDFGLPYGGFKQSGLGREGGVEGLHAYLETKTILLDAAPTAL
jgi:hypothetical protein